MPNIASVLKDEIARVARKEMRSEVAVLRKATAAHRTEIAALKRRAQDLEKQIRALLKSQRRVAPEATEESLPRAIRFSAKGLASQRRRLALSAEDCGLLVGASGQSIYNWEAGKARPRATHLAAIAALKGFGKKDAATRLESMRASG
jgi:DNA-binding transcriptional regulator YiaG